MNGSDELSKSIRNEIATSTSAGIYIAAISIWEVAMLATRGRINLSVPLSAWIKRALGAPGIILTELSPEIAMESCRLPGNVHGDPADRMIIATARLTNATVVTRDDRMLDYARGGYVNALKC